MISTHVLDISNGKPANGVNVRLDFLEGDKIKQIGMSHTNDDGRIVFNCEKKQGIYQLTFEIEDYLKRNSKEYFFLMVPVLFKVNDTKRNYHVPLLLNPFGYSTYRGS